VVDKPLSKNKPSARMPASPRITRVLSEAGDVLFSGSGVTGFLTRLRNAATGLPAGQAGTVIFRTAVR
jgi:hypothetical protein